MKDSFSLRTLAVLAAAIMTIYLIFTEGSVTGILFAGVSFFLGSLFELFQHRERLERGRLILMTVFYTVCVFVLLVGLIWRYRELFL